MIALRRIVSGAFVGLVLMLVGAVLGIDPTALWAGWPGPLALLAQGLVVTVAGAFAHPRAAVALTAVVVVPVALGRLISLIPRRVHTDPQRLYTVDQRRGGFERAEGRCEGEVVPFFRCPSPATQGDHWFPWSKGGPTNMENFVGLCQPCNGSKSNRIPTFWQTQRLVFRRRRYFPEHLTSTPGGRYEARGY